MCCEKGISVFFFLFKDLFVVCFLYGFFWGAENSFSFGPNDEYFKRNVKVLICQSIWDRWKIDLVKI